jgi:hypothetical protein
MSSRLKVGGFQPISAADPILRDIRGGVIPLIIEDPEPTCEDRMPYTITSGGPGDDFNGHWTDPNVPGTRC